MRSRTQLTLVLLLLSSATGCLFFKTRRPLTWRVTLEISAPVSERQQALKESIQVLERRLDSFGLPVFKVQAEDEVSSNRIVVQLPDVTDRERIKQLIVTEGKLELIHVISPPSPAPSQTYATEAEATASVTSGGALPANRRVLRYVERMDPTSNASATREKQSKWVIVEAPAIIDGSELRNASAVPTRVGGTENYEIIFSLKKNGADKFGAWTGSHINEYMGVALNDEVHSIAFIKSQIFDSGQIEGRFTKETAEDLARVLNSGRLPFPAKIVSEASN